MAQGKTLYAILHVNALLECTASLDLRCWTGLDCDPHGIIVIPYSKVRVKISSSTLLLFLAKAIVRSGRAGVSVQFEVVENITGHTARNIQQMKQRG